MPILLIIFKPGFTGSGLATAEIMILSDMNNLFILVQDDYFCNKINNYFFCKFDKVSPKIGLECGKGGIYSVSPPIARFK